MNGRIQNSPTPEGRIAAVVMSVLKKRTHENWWLLDYADFARILKPHIEKVEIHAALHELIGERAVGNGRKADRELFLYRRLAELEAEILTQGL